MKEPSGWDTGDLPRVVDAIRAVGEVLCIDRQTMYAIGAGPGGRVAAHLPCRVEAIRAIATSGYNSVAETERRKMCRRRVPYLHIVGRDDPMLPAAGGRAKCGNAALWGLAENFVNDTRPLAEHEADWLSRMGCGGEKKVYAGTENEACSTWDCDTAYVTCNLEGGRHWTVRFGVFDKFGCYRPSSDFDVEALTWKFFQETTASQ
jgi:poly(3-hydroxybutyrate) depolymerase